VPVGSVEATVVVAATSVISGSCSVVCGGRYVLVGKNEVIGNLNEQISFGLQLDYIYAVIYMLWDFCWWM
jgi:hypothetical protein